MQHLCDQDREDFEQEKRINEWLNRDYSGRPELLESWHINRKGNARNTLIQARFSLDQNVRKDDARGGTFADLVAGYDGRDLENGDGDYHFREHFESTVTETLQALGLREREIEWLKNLWRHSETINVWHSQTSMTDLEWESL